MSTKRVRSTHQYAYLRCTNGRNVNVTLDAEFLRVGACCRPGAAVIHALVKGPPAEGITNGIYK